MLRGMNGAVVAILAVGVLIEALLTVAAARFPGLARRGIFFGMLAYGLWVAGCAGLYLGMPGGLYWGGTRPLVLVLLTVLTALSPGTSLSRREMIDLSLDGVMSAVSLLVTFWILADYQTWEPHRVPPGWPTLWVLASLMALVPMGGMLAVVPARQRRPLAVGFLNTVIVLAGDVLALVTGTPRLGVPFWLAGGLLTAVAFVVYGSTVYDEPFPVSDRPHAIRIWQLPVPAFIAYVLIPVHHGVVVQTGVSVIGVGVLTLLVAHSRRSERSWFTLADRTRRYQELLHDSQDAIVRINFDGVVEYANPAVAGVLGVDPAQLVGRPMRERAHPDDREVGFGLAREFDFSRRHAFTVVTRYPPPLPDGRLYDLADPAVHPPGHEATDSWHHVEWTVSQRGDQPGWILSGRDVTERVRLQAELATQARTDTLTGLVNRGAFLTAVDARLSAGDGAAVLFLDLDGFKAVNDTVGHAQGDELLRRAAECLAEAVSPGDVVARLGGDEFAVLCLRPEVSGAERLGEQLISAFNGFDETASGRPSISASIGIAVSGTGTAVELLRDADLAMYRAKQRGGGSAVRFEAWMSERVLERSRLRGDLEQAVRAGGLALHLQPVVDLPTGGWEGFEALVRWPVGGQTWSPGQFLPVAEETGLIVPMGTWVLQEALRQLVEWGGPGGPGEPDGGDGGRGRFGMAVNVSAQQLVRSDLVDLTLRALEATGVEPGRLTLELTEEAAVQDLNRTASRLQALRAAGVHVAVDDFGTGYSSMQYLSRLPVDILKIDQKFVFGLGRSSEDDVLVRSIIRLADELGLDVIAEGVETRAQADFLIAHGCRLAQGFLFSPPRPLAELRARLGERPGPPVPRPRAGSNTSSNSTRPAVEIGPAGPESSPN